MRLPYTRACSSGIIVRFSHQAIANRRVGHDRVCVCARRSNLLSTSARSPHGRTEPGFRTGATAALGPFKKHSLGKSNFAFNSNCRTKWIEKVMFSRSNFSNCTRHSNTWLSKSCLGTYISKMGSPIPYILIARVTIKLRSSQFTDNEQLLLLR